MATSSEERFFEMHGARIAIAGGLKHIEEQVKALELAVIENAGLAFDLARTLIESVCKFIIIERGSSFDKDDDLPKLFKTASSIVPFLPVAMASEIGARKSLNQTLGGLSTALQGICELRNAFGFASHGDSRPRPIMEGVQALLAAQAADAIIGFLYQVHRQDRLRPGSMPLGYNDNPDYNEWIDEQNERVRIFTLEYKPSEVLFGIDPQGYRDLVNDYKREVEERGTTGESEAPK
ncbi:MAG: abortive infection family protein [Syntrophales bacterium]|nr:abortive infection family protein [Syntrophales bacterium]